MADAKIINFTFFAHTYWRIPITFSVNGVPLPLTNCIVYHTVKKNLNDDDSGIVLDKVVTVHDDPEEGFTVIEYESEETGISPGQYVYDIQISDSLQRPVVVCRGECLVKMPARRHDPPEEE